MSDIEYTVVPTFNGLYDEKSAAETHNINNLLNCRFHLNHDFINASLDCRFIGHDGRERYIALHSPAVEHFNSDWGNGYGGIRFCRRCKVINCIHVWDTTANYEIEHSKYYSTRAEISHCVHCNKRIIRGGSSCCKPSEAAMLLLDKVFIEAGKFPLYSKPEPPSVPIEGDAYTNPGSAQAMAGNILAAIKAL
jgi:hypothetical protein